MAFNKSCKLIYNSPFYLIVAKTSNIFSGGEYLRILFSYSPLKISDNTGYYDINIDFLDDINTQPDININLGTIHFIKFIFYIFKQIYIILNFENKIIK